MRLISIGLTSLLLFALAGALPAQGVLPKKQPGKGPALKDPITGPSSKDKSSPKIVTEVGGKKLKEWKDLLTHKDPSRAREAIIAIPYFGDQAASCVSLFLKRTTDRDTSPKVKAVIALRVMPVHKEDVPKVVRALAIRVKNPPEPQAIVRYEAIQTLTRFAADASEAIPSLIEATRDSNSWEIRQAAVRLLTRVGRYDGGQNEKAVNALIQATIDPTYHVRLEAIQGLGIMGRPNDPMLAARVFRALNYQIANTTIPGPTSRALHIWCYASLAIIDSDKVRTQLTLQKLGKYLNHKTMDTRLQAARALGALGKAAKSQVPVLIAMSHSDSPASVAAACAALSGIGDNSDRVVDAMIDLLGNKEPGCVVSALGTLVQLHAGGRKVLAALQKQLDRDPPIKKELRPFITYTIEQLKLPPKKVAVQLPPKKAPKEVKFPRKKAFR